MPRRSDADADTGDGDGDEGAEQLARELYDAHGPALASWARRRFTDPGIAEEVVQEVVLSAWRKHHQFDPDRGSERAWMFGIAHNVAATRHRAERRHLRSVPVSDPDDAGDLDEDLAAVADRSLVADAVAALSHDHRAVIVEAFFHGLTSRQIAQRLDIPVGTVKSRMFYGLRALRTFLEEHGALA